MLNKISALQISSWNASATSNYLDQGHCLFHSINGGYCNSSLLNSPNFLDLGGALAAFGLIFAVYQLRKPEWDVVLRIRDGWQQKLFWILGGAGLLISLLRVLMTQVPLTYLPYPLDTPIFYEILAYFFFIASPISLIYFANKKSGLFKEKSARKFYEVLVRELSSSKDERVNAVIEILLTNFRSICEFASRDDLDIEIRGSAIAILDVILSDETVVKIFTTKRLDALLYIFSEIEKYAINRRHSGIGIPKIVQNLFYDKESFLYKQLDRKGLALSYDIYEAIFASPIILSNFDLFGYPTLGFSIQKDGSDLSINVFIRSLSKAIETYLKTGSVPARHINDGLSHLSGMFGSLCSKLSVEENRGVDTKYSLESEWWSLHNIANFLGHDYPFLAYQDELNIDVIEKEKSASKADFNSNLTINDAIAAVLYKAFAQLSSLKKTNDIYHIVLELFQCMTHEENLKQGYRDPFEKRIWEQIANNVINRYYPAVLRTYLIYIGFSLASDEPQRTGWVGEQAERMRRLLYVDLKPLLEKDEKMANKELMRNILLPDCMDYKDGKFTYKLGFGDGPEKLILPPPDGSASALENIDLENSLSLI